LNGGITSLSFYELAAYVLLPRRANWEHQDLDKDEYIPEPFEEAPAEQVFELRKKELNERKRKERSRQDKLTSLGFEVEHSTEVIF
jgi:hypothetical protein